MFLELVAAAVDLLDRRPDAVRERHLGDLGREAGALGRGDVDGLRLWFQIRRAIAEFQAAPIETRELIGRT